jgi:hypothetical protein
VYRSLAILVLAVLLTAVPADHQAGSSPLGRLATLLTLVPANAASRVETVVDVEVSIGDRIVRPPDEEVDSIAAVDDVLVLANAFDEVAVGSAAFSTDVHRFSHDGGVLLPYRAVATGAGPGVLAIAFAQASTADAAENASRFRAMVASGSSVAARRPWSELLRARSIEARGRVVVAVLLTRSPTLWLQLEREPDSLLWWQPR